MWRFFGDLNETRRYVVVGDKIRAERIPFRELAAWQAANRIMLEAWQLAAISMIDERYIAIFNDPDQALQTPLTPDLVNSLFGKKK